MTAFVTVLGIYLVIGLVATPKLDPNVKPVDWAAAGKRAWTSLRWAPLLIKKIRDNRKQK